MAFCSVSEMRGQMRGPPSSSINCRISWSMGRRLRSRSSWRRRMISPPTSQRLSRWRLKVVLDTLRRSRSSRKGLKVATMVGARRDVRRFALPSPWPVVQIRAGLAQQGSASDGTIALLVDSWP